MRHARNSDGQLLYLACVPALQTSTRPFNIEKCKLLTSFVLKQQRWIHPPFHFDCLKWHLPVCSSSASITVSPIFRMVCTCNGTVIGSFTGLGVRSEGGWVRCRFEVETHKKLYQVQFGVYLFVCLLLGRVYSVIYLSFTMYTRVVPASFLLLVF